jgi:molybdopterin molybdotransferase
MISYSAALELIAARLRPLLPGSTPLATALGHVAADTVVSTVAVPSFVNAAMDGFAMRSTDVSGASPASPVELAIAGSVMAGQAPPPVTSPGQAWEITTGAPMPAGCDAVVPVERAQLVRNGQRSTLRITAAVAPGLNRRDAGTDFAAGDRLLRGGDPVTAQAIMGLAAVGRDTLATRATPRVAIVTTGSELAATGLPSATGIIRDVNGPYLGAMLSELGLPLVACRTVPDDAQRLIEEIGSLASASDLILTTGGVSAGRLDFVPGAIARMGGTIHFHKVAIRPGKPLLFAQLPGGTPLLGLPGNPMAVAVGLRFFVLPAVRALMGRPVERWLPARSATAVRKREGLTFFAKALAQVTPEATLSVQVLAGQESFRIRPLLGANCWAVVPAGRDDVAPGEILEVAPLLPTDFPAGPGG